jgi:hypothetical protein
MGGWPGATTLGERSSSARAGGPGPLLELHTKVYVHDNGSLRGAGLTSNASAEWIDDGIYLRAMYPDTAVPDAVRLHFNMTFTPDSAPPMYGMRWSYGSINANINDASFTISPTYQKSPGYDESKFDSIVTNPSGDYALGTKIAKFHVDIPVRQLNESLPLSISLAASSSGALLSDRYLGSNGESHDASLDLTNITLTDGSSLKSRGLAYDFKSGLNVPSIGTSSAPQPAPVPEPGSIAVWALVAVAGGIGARARARGR